MTRDDAQALVAEVEREPMWHAEVVPDFFARTRTAMTYPPDWKVEIWHDEVPQSPMRIKQRSEWLEMKEM